MSKKASLSPRRSLPHGPWIASDQYGMRFILSANNEILWRADWMPMKILRSMVRAANNLLPLNYEQTNKDI